MELIKGGKDYIDVTNDEKFEKFIEAMKRQAMRKKNMIALPESIRKLNAVLTDLKYLLDRCELDGEDYSISIERLNPFPNCIIIMVDTESFGVAPVDFETFKRLIGNLDSFSSSMAQNGKMRYYFEISDMFVRQK